MKVRYLSKTYRFLIKIYYFVINPFRKIYWFLVRPKTRGVKCLIQFGDKYLLTRIGYAHKMYTIPGGGVKKNETFEQAVRREVLEEVGIKLGEIIFVTEYKNQREYKQDTVQVFKTVVQSEDFEIDGVEVVEAGWFTRDNLPPNRVPRIDALFSLMKI